MTQLAKVPSARPLSESEEIEGELRKEDLVWSEHEFNDGDHENRRVLRKFLGKVMFDDFWAFGMGKFPGKALV